MSDNRRIDDLRRRVDHDPASIAFAQLAEEHRRAGDCEEAVRVCAAGLEQHPAYVSARVTLGRALLELGRTDEARAEFSRVLDAAPGHAVAATVLTEIGQPRADRRRPVRPMAARLDRRRTGTDDQVLAELEAWLDVIRERRLLQPHR